MSFLFSAREALRSKHPLMKLRPLSKSSPDVQAKARSSTGTNTVLWCHQFVLCVTYLNAKMISVTLHAHVRPSSDDLLPAKERPQTSAAMARRLVIGALGVKSNQTDEQREAEKRKLQAAKGDNALMHYFQAYACGLMHRASMCSAKPVALFICFGIFQVTKRDKNICLKG